MMWHMFMQINLVWYATYLKAGISEVTVYMCPAIKSRGLQYQVEYTHWEDHSLQMWQKCWYDIYAC